MMTMHLDMVTYAQTQKIKPYKNDILIGISVDPFTNHYCFNIFRNNSSIAGQLFTNQIGLSLSDFTRWHILLLKISKSNRGSRVS